MPAKPADNAKDALPATNNQLASGKHKKLANRKESFFAIISIFYTDCGVLLPLPEGE